MNTRVVNRTFYAINLTLIFCSGPLISTQTTDKLPEFDSTTNSAAFAKRAILGVLEGNSTNERVNTS